VACLYCGKNIDAIEPTRDGEFRSPAPRQYEERLRETLDRIAAPEPSPAASDSWMPGPAAEPVAREARLSVAYALYGNAAPKPAVLRPFKMAVAPAESRVKASAEPAVANARPPDVPASHMPEPGFIPPDFHCENVRGAVVDRLEWREPNIAPLPPRFALRPVDDQMTEPVPRQAALQTSRPSGRALHRVVDAIAASLFVAAGLWFGAGAAGTLRRMAFVGQEISATGGPAPAWANPARETGVLKRPLSWARSTIARRAAVELTDTFHGGMEYWNAAPKSWAPGWSRHPDGYVRTGQLALYRPSAAYSNYRLEFFGQIESKSMGWVVRARDRQNYYAMKFTVVDPGLRPIIAIVHYPVVGGKKGHKVEVPLSVMVHNNTPYHVSVEVKGNRVITSIEGQEVDRWVDDTLASGGVGFFSEPGERARLYWMKLAANDDLLGMICAYLSGGSAEGPQRTAERRRQEPPAEVPQPRPGSAPPGRPEETVLAAATPVRTISGTGGFKHGVSRANSAGG
jgi:hypothetical protein